MRLVSLTPLAFCVACVIVVDLDSTENASDVDDNGVSLSCDQAGSFVSCVAAGLLVVQIDP
jgi:hypothetical protein